MPANLHYWPWLQAKHTRRQTAVAAKSPTMAHAGVAVRCEDGFQSTLRKRIKPSSPLEWGTGLLVGVPSSPEHAEVRLVLCVPTPSMDAGDSKGCPSADQFSEDHKLWVWEHAAQVQRLLPGGLAVVGLYNFVSDAAASSVTQPRAFAQCAADICLQSAATTSGKVRVPALVATNRATGSSGDFTLWWATSTGKGRAATPKMDAAGTLAVATGSLVTLHAVLPLDRVLLTADLSQESFSTQRVLEHVGDAVPKVDKMLQESLAVVNGTVVAPDCKETIKSMLSSAKPHQLLPGRASFAVRLLLPAHGTSSMECPVQEPLSSGKVLEEMKKELRSPVCVTGSIVGLAVVRPNASAAAAAAVLRNDLANSLTVRVQCLQEDVAESNNDEDAKAVVTQVQLPSRVLLSVQPEETGPAWLLCDHQLPHENTQELSDRVEEILGCAPRAVVCVEASNSSAQETDRRAMPKASPPKKSAQAQQQSMPVRPAAMIAVLAIAVLLALWLRN